MNIEKKAYKLKLNNVSKKFGSKIILKNISVTLSTGTVIAVVGKNGSGKTTLTNLISGFWSLSSGEILKDGFSNYKVSYLFQSTFLDMHLSIQNNLHIIALMQRLDRNKFIHDVSSNIKDIFNVNLDFNRKVKSLSQGQKRMLEFSISVTNDCDILLLDEPTAHFDINAKEKSLNWLKNYIGRKSFITIINTHDSDEFDICDKYICLDDKCLVSEGEIGKKTYKEIFNEI